jgi:thiol peroxidase
MKVKFKGNDVELKGKQFAVNETIPEFTVTDPNMNSLNFKDTTGVRILLAVPSIDTSVCDLEVATFNDKVKELPNITCYTISMDLPFAQARWCAAKGIENVKIYSDYKDRSFADVSGTYIKELGLLTRAAFVIDSGNRIVYADYMEEVSSQPNFEQVLEAAKNAK